MIWITIGIVVIAILILVSAFFSSAEMAFVSVNKALIIDKARNNDKHAMILEKLLKNPDHTVSAIVVGNNLVNIFASTLAGAIATITLGDIGVGVATLVMFFLVIVFSEATPKAFGIKNQTLALRIARPISFITKLFYPIVVLLNKTSRGIIRLFGAEQNTNHKVTEEEILAMVKLGEEDGAIESDESELVSEALEFDDTIADEVDNPTPEIEFIHQDAPISQLIKKSIKTGFSRFPVYRKNYDDVIGMVHIKDTLIIDDLSLPVTHILRKILKIQKDMKADDVLLEMKKQKTHLAILQDDAGKTIGLVSMEDLIEELFGDISDEHDRNPT